jgi:predicted nucleic acid-binding protein
LNDLSWLIDKSALAKLGISPDADAWLGRIERGLVHITVPTLLEIGYSARSANDWSSRTLEPPASLMPPVYLTPAIEARAVELQGILARRGQHRAPSVPDLLIASTAELSGLTLLHDDKDFDLIAEITGQALERLATT